jgi:hypothetical protein
MHAVTIAAYRAVMPDCWPPGFVNGYIHAMPGEPVKVIDISWQIVFRHQFSVGVAPRAQVGLGNAELFCTWIMNIVHAMAVSTNRHIRIIFLD